MHGKYQRGDPARREWHTDSCLFRDSTPGSCDTTAKETDFIQWSFLVDSDHGDIRNDRVLRECGGAHLESRYEFPISQEECTKVVKVDSQSGGLVCLCK